MGEARYQRILRAIVARPWAIDPNSLAWATIRDLILFRAAGGELTDSEIQARISAANNGPRRGGRTSGAVAVIPVYGPISARMSLMSNSSGGTSLDDLTGSIDSALADPSIDAIVLEVDSPGGTVDGVPEAAAKIRGARGQKPIYAIANTMAASAAYWLAAQAEQVFVTKSGSVGSIGIFAAHHDMSAAYEQAGEKVTLVSAGKFKTEGNEYEPLSDEAKAAIQSQVDVFYGMFTSDVAKGRGVSVDAVRSNFGQGRVVLANDALAAGMVDGIDTLENVVRAAARAASTRSRAATAAADPAGISADLGTGLPWAEHLALGTAVVGGLLEHAKARFEMRAKDGRDTLSRADRGALRGLAERLTELADVESETEPPLPMPEPPAPEPPSALRSLAPSAVAVAAYLGGYMIPEGQPSA